MASVVDPVCGMTIDSTDAAAQAMYEGQVYYFCSTECRDKFLGNPKEYLKAKAGD
jgi:Cu+-exporting ATPase